MKTNRLLIITALLTPLVGSATLVYEESFDTPSPYSTSLLNGQNGWTAETDSSFGRHDVTGTGLTYIDLANSGGAATYSRGNSGGGSVNKAATVDVSSSTALAVNGGPDLWASALISFDPNMERTFVALDFVDAGNGTSLLNAAGFGFFNGEAFLGEASAPNAILSGTTGGTFAANTTHLVLLKIEGGSTDTMSLWINPDLSLGEAGLGSATITRSFGVFNTGNFLSQVGLVTSTAASNPGGNQTVFDEIKVGTSFEDIGVIPEPGTMVLLGVGLGALAVFRRRR